MAKLSAPEKVKLTITPSWPILCVGLFLLALIIQNSDSVDRFFVTSYIHYTPRAEAQEIAETAHVPAATTADNNVVPETLDEKSDGTIFAAGSAPPNPPPPTPVIEELGQEIVFKDDSESAILAQQQKNEEEENADVETDDKSFVPSEGVQKLVELLRQATLKASRGEPVDFTEADRKTWEEQHPCRSRGELRSLYAERKHMKDVPINRQWNLVFSEYEKLHRTCTSKIGDLQQYFESKNTSSGCKFLVTEPHFGLGNKLFHTASTLMLAILTQRVILIPKATSIPALFCEPFAGSSWGIDDAFHSLIKDGRKPSEQFFKQVDHDKTVARKAKGTLGNSLYASAMNDEWVGPEPRFWCNTEQKYMSSVTWLTVSGCTLFVHKLMAIDIFRQAMEDLFPQKIVVTYLLRSVLLPTDPAWERILHVNEVYLSGAQKQVGVQVRFFQEDEEYKLKNEQINNRITKCMWEQKILPEVCPANPRDKALADPKFADCKHKLTAEDHQNPKVLKVLIGSLFLGLHDHLNDIYLRHEMTTTKEAVGIIQLTHELIQGDGVEVDTQALVEIISLSMSDVLLITPMSTFGGVIHAYGGLIPWFIEFGPEEDPAVVCERGKGIEPCYMGASQYYECKYDDAGQQKISDVVPYLKDCLAIDVGYGYRLNMIPEGYGMQMTPENFKDQDFSID
ncbi:hypothetical protein Mapa_006197 [Marchantia paleacea]|nr:hypothetical protein Mapa_006197 [Marchantia paleacea]